MGLEFCCCFQYWFMGFWVFGWWGLVVCLDGFFCLWDLEEEV